MEKLGKALDANGNKSSEAESDCHSDESNT